MRTTRHQKTFVVERVQTGVRMEKRLLKVLKALAEFHDLTLGDLLEGIVLHAFDGKAPFQEASRQRIKQLKRFYGLDLDARASHRLTEVREVPEKRRPRAAAKKERCRPARRSHRPRAPKKERSRTDDSPPGAAKGTKGEKIRDEAQCAWSGGSGVAMGSGRGGIVGVVPVPARDDLRA